MERYCGSIQPAIRSRRHPYASIDNHVVAAAQLSQIKLKYNLAEKLRLRAAPTQPRGMHSSDACEYCEIVYLLILLTLWPTDPTCVLISPHKSSTFTEGTIFEKVLIHFATRFKKTVAQLRPHIKIEYTSQWARVRRLEGGDDMYASSLKNPGDDYRDATYIRVSHDLHRAI